MLKKKNYVDTILKTFVQKSDYIDSNYEKLLYPGKASKLKISESKKDVEVY